MWCKRLSFLLLALTIAGLTIGVPFLEEYVNPDIKDPDDASVKNRLEFVRLIVQIVGGAVVLSGAYFTWQRLELTQEGQVTDRFTKAIEQLGSEHLEIRLGGIYALERIARDSFRDHWSVMEVLTAYVRENAPAKAKESKTTLAEAYLEPTNVSQSEQEKPKPATDIQAILTVISRRKAAHRVQEPQRLNLKETDLRGASLKRSHLEGANFLDAHLEGADLNDAHLEGANFLDAHLEGTDLSDAHLERANLLDAHLEGAVLWDAHLEGASLIGAHLEGASLIGAHLEGASLIGAHLEEAILTRAHLEGADLGSAHLEGAFFYQTHLEGASLIGTNLEGASLIGAHLEGADFRSARLEGASLIGAHLEEAISLGVNLSKVKDLTAEQLQGAKLCATTLPEGIDLDPNRDCKQMPDVLVERYKGLSLDRAKAAVEAAMKQ